MRCLLLAVMLKMAVIGAFTAPLQSQTSVSGKPSFEVASVKPSAAAGNFMGIGRAPGGRFTANNVPLRFLIQNAYRVRDFQIIGGPGWMASERWDVEAKAEEGSIPAATGPPDPNVPDPMSIRLQSLLEDRFQMKLHRETRELPIYTLTVAKDGLKMNPSKHRRVLYRVSRRRALRLHRHRLRREADRQLISCPLRDQ